MNTTLEHTPTLDRFDYDRQAWIVDGRYVRCGHLRDCQCYGRLHEGEAAPLDTRTMIGLAIECMRAEVTP